MTIWEWLQTSRGELTTSGLAGAAVSAIVEWEGVISTLRKFFIGGVTAYHLGPLGVPLFSWALFEINVPDEHAMTVGGFVIGVGGAIIVEIILKIFRVRKSTIEVRHD